MKLSLLTPRSMGALTAGIASSRLDMTTVAWTELAAQIALANRRRRFTGGALRTAVFVVVREMRARTLSWDTVYGALTAVAGAPSLELVHALDCYTYSSRQASLVAHMHAWADCERLEEIARADDAERSAER